MNRQDIFEQIKKKKSFLCVGLDPDLQKLPSHLLGDQYSIFSFCKQIVDATAPYAVAFKPNIAFFEAYGSPGLLCLEKTIDYINSAYPELFTIIDAKRGDIDNTAAMYANAFFREMNFDAVTLSPYMGFDSIKPFLSIKGKWVIILAVTSNPGSEDFQTTTLENGDKLFESVIKKVITWGNPDNTMFVVGATKTEYLKQIRKISPDSFLLVPGIITQGGSLEKVAETSLNNMCGLLVNSSRSIIYASQGKDFAIEAAAEAKKIQGQMEIILHNNKLI